MARPDLVPPLADTLDVIAALDADELERCWIWVATPRHVEKAAAAGARNFQYCFSASDSHNKANIGRSTEDSVAAMPDAVRIAQEVGGSIQLCIATAFTCPFEGLTDPERVIGIAADPRTAGADDIVVCDTIGQAIPTQVTDLIAGLKARSPAAAHRLSRTRHLGPRRGEHARRDRRRSHDGRRIAGRPRRLPVRARRQRQHLHRGPAVRDPAGLVHPRHAGGDGGHHRQAPRRTRRAEPLQDRSGRAVQGQGVRLGHRRRRSDDVVTGGPAFLVTYPIPEPGMSSLHAAGRVHVPADTAHTSGTHAKPASSGEFDVVVSQLSDRFDAQLLARRKWRESPTTPWVTTTSTFPPRPATRSSWAIHRAFSQRPLPIMTMLLILATARRAVEADQYTRSGQFTGWKPDLLLGHDVSGATLGLAGFGRIARATAQRAAAFGMTVSFCSHPPAGRLVDEAELAALPYPARQVSWTELVERSDFLSLHLPLAPTTRHLIDAATLAAMRPTAILINTARGPIVDERALVDALRDGRLAGAGLDVYEREPHLTPGLAELPNTVLLPHVGSATTQVRARMAELCADNAIAIGHGHLPPHCVNPRRGGDADAIGRGAVHVVVAAGGSATTDGGIGAITAIHDSGGPKTARITVLTDVATTFGDAARVFAPQKGATPADVAKLSRRLADLAHALPRDPSDIARNPSEMRRAGAAIVDHLRGEPKVTRGA